MAVLSDTRLLYVSPAPGHSGVGDYAFDFAAEVRPHFKELVEFWVDTRPRETARDVIRNVRRIRAVAKDALADGPVIVHFEQSAASLTPFWGAMLPRRIPVTATIHDAPQPVWWPFDTRLVSSHRLLHHGVHYPFRFAINALQRRMCRGRIVVALTSVGARDTGLRMRGADARATRMFIPPRPAVASLTERPLAVGLFGYLYRGKGFDKLKELRAHLDDDIEVVVAGRGTDTLPAEPGITVLGEVNGSEEDRFFERIRFLVVPYGKLSRYGVPLAASAAVARSYAYGTPIICNLDGALAEIATEGGAVSVDGDISEIARRANTAVRDEETLRKLADEVSWLRAEHDVTKCAAPVLNAWAEIAAGMAR